jgi:hypothetical protein
MAGATWVRSVSGGGDRPLVVEDALTAEQPGQYEVVSRLRLLGAVEGGKGKWIVRQKGATLPVTLEVVAGDEVGVAKWMPDDHARDAGAYPRCPFVEQRGIPKTIEWRRTIRLSAGEKTVFVARLGPVDTAP